MVAVGDRHEVSPVPLDGDHIDGVRTGQSSDCRSRYEVLKTESQLALEGRLVGRPSIPVCHYCPSTEVHLDPIATVVGSADRGRRRQSSGKADRVATPWQSRRCCDHPCRKRGIDESPGFGAAQHKACP